MDAHQIIEIVCGIRGISTETVLSYESKSEAWYTRYMLWMYLHTNKRMSANKIARIFNRNRPTIFRGIRLLKHQMVYDKALSAEYETIVKKIEDAGKSAPSDIDMEK